LLICHVDQNDLVNDDDTKHFAKYGPTQCYLISREGQKGLIAYAANMKVGFGWTRKPQSSFKHVIEILDGELVIDNPVGQHPESCKFLIFDILVHLQENITKLPLISRLKESVKFMECNNFLLENTPASKKQK
jgi:predicted SnoaL-like aldol condensation-catalyzing enzyme